MAKSLFSREADVLVRLLRERREAAGITQVELAAALGLNQPIVSKVERGERRLDVIELRRWCEALGISFVGFIRELDRRLS